jgi:hypothetical protein
MNGMASRDIRFSRVILLLLVVLLPITFLTFSLQVIAWSGRHYPESTDQSESMVFLPSLFSVGSLIELPVGSYDCLEYEFGLIWTSEVITLYKDGSSIYNYAPPYSGIVTGTWVYTPTAQLVGFTNFRWLTATYEAPDRLWAKRYLPHVDFEIALSCLRR